MVLCPSSTRLLAVVEYDGTDFAGFQFQQRGGVCPRTVQLELERAIRAVTRETVRVAGSGRTDTGVHARMQVIHFDSESMLAADLQRLRQALNAHLPADLRVHLVERAPAGFHARYSATCRAYSYRVYNAATPSPLSRRTAYHVRAPLSVALMHAAAQHLVGSHDFIAFAAQQGQKATRREVFRAEVVQVGEEWANRAPIWQTLTNRHHASRVTASAADLHQPGRLIEIRVEANAFLRHMMRRIAGTLIRVGGGRLEPGDVAAILASCEKGRAGPTAPAHGLCLERVDYGQNGLHHGGTGDAKESGGAGGGPILSVLSAPA